MQADYLGLLKEIGSASAESSQRVSSILDSHFVLLEEELTQTKLLLEKNIFLLLILFITGLMASICMVIAASLFLLEQEIVTTESSAYASVGAVFMCITGLVYWRCRSTSFKFSFFPHNTFTSIQESFSCLKDELH